MKIFGAIFILEAALHIETFTNRLPVYAISVILILIGDVLENQPNEI
jgi:hypothetical protein